jgi:RNA polymerase sigma factor (sigma-70 family)
MTQWTTVVKIRESENEESARRALADLCQNYWYPLYAFARRLGRSPEDSQDLTQGYFYHALEKNLFASAKPELGKLRTYLLTTFRRYISDVREHDSAQKRCGGGELLSLDVIVGEEKYYSDLATASTPESLFEKSWAMSVIKSAVAQLGLDEEKSGRGVEFKALEAFLSPDMAPEDYSEIATRLGVTEPALRQMVSRLRKKFRVFLRSVIAGTLTDADEKQVDEEILTLRAALRD